MSYLAVFLGGGLGSVCRFALARWAIGSGQELIWATLGANVLACLVLGALAAEIIGSGWRPDWRILVAAGFCGGFSTFSTFSLEAFTLAQNGRVGLALLYVGLSLLLGLVAVGVWRWWT